MLPSYSRSLREAHSDKKRDRLLKAGAIHVFNLLSEAAGMPAAPENPVPSRCAGREIILCAAPCCIVRQPASGNLIPAGPISLLLGFDAAEARRGGANVSCALASASIHAATARGAGAWPWNHAFTSHSRRPSSSARSAGFHLRIFRHWRKRPGIMS